MGKRPPKRVLPTGLREVLGRRVTELMANSENLNTQAKLGAKAGIGQRTAGRIKQGEKPTNIDTIQAIAEAFGVEPWELLRERKGNKERTLYKVDDDLKAVSSCWQYLTSEEREDIRKTASQKAAKNRRIVSEFTTPPTGARKKA